MADQYRKFSISPLTLAQSNTLYGHFKNLNFAGISVSLYEHNPDTQTVTISIGGPDLSAALTRIRNFFQTRIGRLPDVDVDIAPGEKCKTAADIQAGLVFNLADDPRREG